MKEQLVLCDGKYTFYLGDKIIHAGTPHQATLKGVLICDRYDSKGWRDFVGDNAVLALFQHALNLPGPQKVGDMTRGVALMKYQTEHRFANLVDWIRNTVWSGAYTAEEMSWAATLAVEMAEEMRRKIPQYPTKTVSEVKND